VIGSFPSIASMGSILFMGIAACLATALIILPALLSFEKETGGEEPIEVEKRAKNPVTVPASHTKTYQTFGGNQ
jgi:predicted RND superfamily exporter protein